MLFLPQQDVLHGRPIRPALRSSGRPATGRRRRRRGRWLEADARSHR
ncbi:unnamed protein product [Spirodela intermedia]|uniref:Uncharacterized protein n=1 Tax=Spirodela intermedia TaxID=51605 RepID=A0A7I8IZY7_SPIIN|nr:unnamed protein product [Spirodela intermedia]CAA6663535.1 unnamed protein product [Spirodela intermedia]